MMKKIFLLIVVLTCSYILPAQDTAMVFDKNGQSRDIEKMRCYVTMVGGKMMKVRDGDIAPLKVPIILKNGTIINLEGVVQQKDGLNWKLREGQRLYFKQEDIIDR